MAVTISDVKVAVILIFEDMKSPFRDPNLLYPKKGGYLQMGIIEDDYFVDIETKEIYPILFIDEEGFPCEWPEYEKPYVYGISSYKPKEGELEKVVRQAQEAHDWYQSREKPEKTGNLISFEKRKKARKNG